jgi:YgiT-type zinc finger domain-containing protein
MTPCPVCRHGSLNAGTTSVTLERGGLTLVFKAVPARVCDNCGERFVDSAITAGLLEQAETAIKAGVQVEVRQYAA